MKKLPILLTTASLVFTVAISGFACDISDNGDTGNSENGNGTTDTIAPIISSVTVSDITETTATISWITDESATSNIEYGTTTSYSSSIPSTADATADSTNHTLNLSGLSSNTTYHFRVKSKDADGNEAASNDQTFTTASPSATPTGELSVHFIDVGQGDAILIDYGDTEVLIDGGGSSPGITGYLNTYVDGDLEVMVATHPHADHIGGLTVVLNTFQVAEIWHNGDTSTSQTYTNFIAAVNTEGAQVHVARRGDEIQAGDLTFSVLHPVTISDTTNNNSVVLSLCYGDIDFIFTGDAEYEAESSMVAAGVLLDVEILKVGHHGSTTASSASFLSATSPEVAIYMAATGNTYGHPHDETIVALDSIGVAIYGTDIHGTITVTTNGIDYDVELTNEVAPVTL